MSSENIEKLKNSKLNKLSVVLFYMLIICQFAFVSAQFYGTINFPWYYLYMPSILLIIEILIKIYYVMPYVHEEIENQVITDTYKFLTPEEINENNLKYSR